MKSFKIILFALAGASLVGVSSARAALSDFLSLFGPTGTLTATVTASEAQEAGNPFPLFSFDHNLSNPAAMGHYVEIIDPATGLISDVVGVDNELGIFPNHMAFLSTDAPGGVTAAMIASAGFTTLDGVFTKETLDSRVDPFLAGYINPATNLPGSYLIFSSAVPDGGSAVALLGMALAGIEGLRRKIGARKA